MKREIPEPWASAMVAAGVTDPRNGERPSWSELGRRIDVHASTLIGMADGSRRTDQSTINRVADVLRVDRTEVASWVGRTRSEAAAYKPPAEADLLDKDERKAVNQLIHLLVRTKQGGSRVAAELRREVDLGAGSEQSDDGSSTNRFLQPKNASSGEVVHQGTGGDAQELKGGPDAKDDRSVRPAQRRGD